jgi:hypothetical protein
MRALALVDVRRLWLLGCMKVGREWIWGMFVLRYMFPQNLWRWFLVTLDVDVYVRVVLRAE